MTDGQSARVGIDGTLLPAEIDPNKPSIARVYDYMIGGKDHFAIDRMAAERALKIIPDAPEAGRPRAHLRRSVRYLVAEAGYRQFVDLGSGLPTTGNVHEIAHEVDPDVRVRLRRQRPDGARPRQGAARNRNDHGDPTPTSATRGDPRPPGRPRSDRPRTARSRCCRRHPAPPARTTRRTRTAARVVAELSPGSYFMISHLLDDGDPRLREIEQFSERTGLGTVRFRTWAELLGLFDGLEMVEPGWSTPTTGVPTR